MRRKHAQPALPTLYFRDGVLSVPGYTFDRATLWEDTGSMTLLAEGTSLKDGTNILAKIAPAHSNASMCLERETHILEQLSTLPDTSIIALRLIDFFTVPKSNGDCVVILLAHPGLNLLGRYFPHSKVNDLLLADVVRTRPSSVPADIYMMGTEEPAMFEEMDPMDVMDLASFLEFAIQATHCLEMLHRMGIIHREVRANAFHLNAHINTVRIVHFGNRAISLEQFGVPSAFVLQADAFEEAKKLKVKESLCYLAPEQTGSMEALTEDHRTDLYSLGIVFWTLLVGRGTMPFEGGHLELLHAIVQKRPPPVHEVRRDVPMVLAFIIEKLLAKNPDARYQSAYGLKADLLQCQRRLLSAVTLATNEAQELIPFFDIATQDRFMEFTIPSPLFGRDKESKTVENVIRHTSTSFARHINATKGSIIVDSSGSGSHSNKTDNDSMSSKSDASVHALSPPISLNLSGSGESSTSANAPTMTMVPPTTHSQGGSPKLSMSVGNNTSVGASSSMLGSSMTLSTTGSQVTGTGGGSMSGTGTGTGSGSDGLRRVALGPPRRPKTHAIVITGPPGAGKSSLILAHQAKWRANGLWGQARFQELESAPFSSLLACLSAVLRQLIVFHTDLHNFVTALRDRLGPQIHNVPLLYQGAPELKDILNLFDIKIEMPGEILETHELRARFQSLVEGVFAVLAETRQFALFLDDLHEANTSSLDLINALINSRSRMLVFITARSDKPDLIERLRGMFSNRSATWVNLEPLTISAVSTLVSRTLHRTKDDCSPLSRVIHAASQGNPFSVRNILTAMYRQGHITFNWDKNHWIYDLQAIESAIIDKNMVADPSNLSYLISHLRELPEDARKYITWASFFGATFQITEVSLMMDWEDSSGSSSDDDATDYKTMAKDLKDAKDYANSSSTARGSMRGLQKAIQEGWLIQRGRDLCTFAHDRYRQAAQAEALNLPEGSIPKMSLRIILMMLHEGTNEIYRIAEHAKRCLPLLRDHPKRDELFELLIDAGDSARTRGAHELALQSFISAYSLLDDNPWRVNQPRTMALCLRLAELLTWKGDFDSAQHYIQSCLDRVDDAENKAKILRLRSRVHWMRGNYTAALGDTISGLHLLGVEVNAKPSRREADAMFEEVKNEILAVGFDNILAIPKARDARTDLAIALLNDAGTNAYWSTGEGFADVIGLTTIQLALRAGVCSGTALGFFWALSAAAEKRELYRFSADLGKLALRIADQYGSSLEKCRALVLYCALVSGYDNVHLRSCLPRAEEALKYGQSGGDRIWTCFAGVHTIQIKLYICEHLNELLPWAEEMVSDIAMWSNNQDSDTTALGQAQLNLIRALAGVTFAQNAETAFDTPTFVEAEYLARLQNNTGNLPVTMNWYNAFKVVGLFCLGFIDQAAELGFDVYATRDRHPNHRHVRYGLFFHCLALIACIRQGHLTEAVRERYLSQIDANQIHIRKWLSPGAVNTSTWIAIIDAEIASLMDSPEAYKLYDIAVKIAVNNDWLMEEGWACYLQGCHFVRTGVEGLGNELQRRGIARHASWGARGIVSYLSANLDNRSQFSLKRHTFTSDVAVQTDNVIITSTHQALDPYGRQEGHEDEISTLTAADLASILKWSKEISTDMSLPLALQRLTEIATENSGSQHTCVVIAREVGDYTVATSMEPPDTCQVHENAMHVGAIPDPLKRVVVQHTLNTKERIYLEDACSEPRFSTEAHQSVHRSVVCLPIISNRGNQISGVIFLGSKYAFSPNTVTMLTLLCEQASIGITNALLFRSVQAGTRENLKMIAAQKDALEAARKSREDALKATKIKSNFLASMSHELRTPFSSFYGLLDILSGTELNPGQREIVQTSKQSCELLLKIIDSILDYSKLEASALKLEYSGFAVENIIADCMELLLPMAAKKLDLSFNIEPDVPPWVKADYARIRQVLMNLIGNAVKFTANGSVRVRCSAYRQVTTPPNEVHLKFEIQDTGIGLSPSDMELLFVPFQQADNSSTRRFGGTGLGLSISRQLVKLMGGDIDVQSELNVGSTFWFTIPVHIYDADDSRAALQEIEDLRSQLMVPMPPHVLIVSDSSTTVSLLNTMLDGFPVISAGSVGAAEGYLRDPGSSPVDFIILDSQSENGADELSRYLHSISSDRFEETKLIHLYTPTNDSLSGHTGFRSDSPGVIRMTKPPRRARLLQTLLSSKNPSMRPTAGGEIVREDSEAALAHRTLYGTVLVAEDNPVAQNLIIKQLERYDLKVVATSNGEEALAEWESHQPGYFSVALFDHHMPICDGVEAAKRLRVLEGKRKVKPPLPIVALSADCQESTKQLCLSAGMNAFLSKPLRKGDLITLLTTFGRPVSVDPPDSAMNLS